MHDDNRDSSGREIQDPGAQQDEAPTLVRSIPGKVESMGRPRVLFTLCRVQRLDRDSAYASVKDLLDGLCAAKLLLGDTEAQIDLVVEQAQVKTRKEERTEIRITPCAQ